MRIADTSVLHDLLGDDEAVALLARRLRSAPSALFDPSDTLKDPVQLRADLDTMIEHKRKVRHRGDPEREAKTWLEKIAEADRKRNANQDQQAEGLLTLDELRAKLLALEETRKTAQRELEALKDHEESMAELEADRDAILQYYEKMVSGALDSLTTEERRHFYALLRLEVLSAPDGSLSLRGAAIPEGPISVCESNPSTPFSCKTILVRRANGHLWVLYSLSSTAHLRYRDRGSMVAQEGRSQPRLFLSRSRRELLPPTATPARLGRYPRPFLCQLSGDERLSVSGQITEASVPEGVRSHPCWQVQPTPHLDHLRRRPEPGLASVTSPESLPRLPASLAQLVGGERASGDVPGQLSREWVSGGHRVRVAALEHSAFG